MVKTLPAMQEIRVQSLRLEDPLEKEMAIHSSILAWKIHRWRNLAGYSPWGHRESDTTEQLKHFCEDSKYIYPFHHSRGFFCSGLGTILGQVNGRGGGFFQWKDLSPVSLKNNPDNCAS